MHYRIYPVYLGGRDVDISTIIFRHAPGEMMRMVIGAYVLQDENGEYIMIDTGAPSADEIRKKGYGLREMADSVEYIDAVRAIGVDPEKVKLIVLTHLHWDHAWNLQYFPNAEIVVQKRELAFALAPTPNARKSYALTKQIGGPNWVKALLQIRAIDGPAQLRDGLRVFPTPGHTPGSQTVVADTKDGLYAFPNDLYINMKNYSENIPTGSVNNVNEWYESHEKVRALGAKILLHHDPDSFKKKVIG
ncbi:MAG: N-acyl homoserine lactonase family protein [Pyramidobacter sp.]|jgi:glyoxylase-like metal-dependent hydrolase (beta-lactamase superfamily II)